jgi:hypothetical protein
MFIGALSMNTFKFHAGTVRVESRLNEGTIFFVNAPLGKDYLLAFSAKPFMATLIW